MNRKTQVGALALGIAIIGSAPASSQQPYYQVPYAVPCPDKNPAKMSIARTSTVGGVLDVLAPITSRASGRVGVEYHAAQRRTRFTASINSVDARIRFRRTLSQRQARKGTGIVTMTYFGDADTRPQQVRLRGAANKARLTVVRPKIVNGRVQASGTVSKSARGVVRLQLEWENPNCEFRITKYRGRISNGKWSINEALTDAQKTEIANRRGVVHSYTLFTGYLPKRIRGEMRSYQVLAKP